VGSRWERYASRSQMCSGWSFYLMMVRWHLVTVERRHCCLRGSFGFWHKCLSIDLVCPGVPKGLEQGGGDSEEKKFKATERDKMELGRPATSACFQRHYKFWIYSKNSLQRIIIMYLKNSKSIRKIE
jgi:hypothetical protein